MKQEFKFARRLFHLMQNRRGLQTAGVSFSESGQNPISLRFGNRPLSRSFLMVITITFLLLLVLPGASRAQKHEDFDEYKLRIETSWFYSNPSGSLQGRSSEVPIDFHKDFGFSSYSTFSGKVDWKISHKNHLYVDIIPFNSSRQTVLQRDITFRGNTFVANAVVQTELHAFLVAPGYQYDIIRRKRGHLGIAVQFDLFNTSAKIKAAAQVVGTPPVNFGPLSANGSILAPLPVAGPQFRLYLTDSPRLYVEGGVNGMYFFGYGDFVSTADKLGVNVNKHVSFTAGYQVGSRLIIKDNTQSNRIGLRMSQKGPVVGAAFTF